MPSIDLTSERFRDQLLGCWLGKNAGGTLGTPLEEAWGKDEITLVDWYTEMKEGGLPNDDLEMQLVWLAALKQVGPALTVHDLARYWLDHIGYNWDEYGLSKANLRLGLRPPLSGAVNNWFRDCMGSPIRSEVWACVAPGNPRIAVRYAYQDAIVDHAGGEGVLGELFNAATQSAAFVVTDPQRLIDIGLSYIPPSSMTALAVRTARDAHAHGLTWQEARTQVLALAPTKVAQYSPFNLAFQVIGLLYGNDFGEAICLTTSCGWDTDSSAGSIGSLWGIRDGKSNLPERWIEPFGSSISTNEDWGGVRHLTDGSAPIPTDLDELVRDLVEQARIVLQYAGQAQNGDVIDVDEANLMADPEISTLWDTGATTVDFRYAQLGVTLRYPDGVTVHPHSALALDVIVTNPHPDPVTARLVWFTPQGWAVSSASEFSIDPQGERTVPCDITAGPEIANTQTLYAAVSFDGYPAEPASPVVLLGATQWKIAAQPSDPSQEPAWAAGSGVGSRIPLDAVTLPGRWFLETWLDVADERTVQIGVNGTVAHTLTLAGQPLNPDTIDVRLRPNLGYGVPTTLTPGLHELVVAFEVEPEGLSTLELHLILSDPNDLMTAERRVGRTRTP